MGSKPTSQSNTTQTSAPPSWVTSAYQSTIGQAQNQATTPYTPYTGQLVAPVNSQQTTGINAINSAAGIQNPYNTGASGLYGAGSSTITPSTVGANQIEQYESPYQSQVVNATEAELQNQNQQQSAALTGNTVASGAMGGDRAGVAQAALAGQQDLANNATIASLNNQNYEQALSEANTQQQTGLQAQEQTAANQLTAGAGLGALGNTAQTEALNLGNAQTNAGTLQQTTSQAADTANYNQYLQQLAYPYQNLSWLSSIEGGLGSLAGGTTTGESQTYSSSPLSTILGGVLGLGSLLIPGAQPAAAAAAAAAARGGRINRANGGGLGLVANMAAGGGLGGQVTPYSSSVDASITPLTPYSSSQQVAPGAGSWVPGSVQISAGHTLPSGMSSGSTGGQQQQNSLTNMLQTSKSIQGLGSGLSNAFQNSSLGDAFNDFTQDNLGFAKGGRLGLGDIRPRHYDDGGSVSSDDAAVSPEDLVDESLMASTGSAFAKGGRMTLGHLGRRHFDDGGTVTPNDLLFDPNAMGLGAAAQQFSPNAIAPQNPVPVPSAVPSGSGLIQASNYDGAWPRGLRNNNPGNLVDNEWTHGLPGYSGSDGRFAVFATPQAGQSALDQNLQSYSNKGVTTPLQIASRWAPSGDGGNDPTSYASFIAKNVGVGINDPLDMSDPAVRSQVAGAITKFENGGNGLGGASLPSNTLAFDDSGNPASPGLGAIANATRGTPQSTSNASDNPITAGLGAIGNLVSGGLGSIGRAVSGQSSTPGSSGFGISDNVRLGLLAAGLGMMGGNSKNPWQNIGQGGLQGIQAMQSGAKNAAEIGLERAQAAYYGNDAAYKAAMVNAMMNGAESAARMYGTPATMMPPSAPPSAASSPPSQPGATNASAGVPITPLGTSAPSASSGAVNGLPPGLHVDPGYEPNFLMQDAGRYAMVAPERARQDMVMAQAILSSNMEVPLVDDQGRQVSTGYYPGVVGSQASKVGATSAVQNAAQNLQTPTAAGMLLRDPNNPSAPPRLIPWSQIQGGNQSGQTISAGAPLDTRLLSSEGAKEVSAEATPILESAAKNNDAAQSTLYRVADMRNELAQLPSSGWLAPGTGFAERNGVAKDINTALSMLGVPDKNLLFDANAVASGQALQKLTRTMGFDLARTLGSREAAMIITQAVGTVPSADNTPLGAKRLLASIEQVAQRQVDWFNYAQQWSAETGGSLLGASAKFNATYPPQQYAARAIVSTLPPGAVSLLRERPQLAAQFEQKYGPGTSKLILGVPSGQ